MKKIKMSAGFSMSLFILFVILFFVALKYLILPNI
jgi:hypothetical protein